MIPDDYLEPITRCSPSHRTNVFTVALDPREAWFVLDRGWVRIDGVRWRVSLTGCDGRIQTDGRVMVRIDCPAEDPLVLPPGWEARAPKHGRSQGVAEDADEGNDDPGGHRGVRPEEVGQVERLGRPSGEPRRGDAPGATRGEDGLEEVASPLRRLGGFGGSVVPPPPRDGSRAVLRPYRATLNPPGCR